MSELAKSARAALTGLLASGDWMGTDERVVVANAIRYGEALERGLAQQEGRPVVERPDVQIPERRPPRPSDPGRT